MEAVSKIHSRFISLVFIHSFPWPYQGWVLIKASPRKGLSFTDGPGQEGSGDTEARERKGGEYICTPFFLRWVWVSGFRAINSSFPFPNHLSVLQGCLPPTGRSIPVQEVLTHMPAAPGPPWLCLSATWGRSLGLSTLVS